MHPFFPSYPAVKEKVKSVPQEFLSEGEKFRLKKPKTKSYETLTVLDKKCRGTFTRRMRLENGNPRFNMPLSSFIRVFFLLPVWALGGPLFCPTGLLGGHNRLLSEIRFEGVRGIPTGTLQEVVDKEPWRKRDWWLRGQGKEGVVPTLSHIRGETSRSPLRRNLGADSAREVFWHSYAPYPHPTQAYQLDLDRLRIVENSQRGENGGWNRRSMEILARNTQNKWKGFFFLRVENKWVPQEKFDGKPIETACLKCHEDSNNPGELSPRPFFLQTAQDFRDVGYIDEELIRRLLKY